MLNFKQFDELRHASPFRPFRIVLTDGASYNVPHRDFAWRAPNVTTIVVASDDVYHMIDPLHITRFEYVKSNGQKKAPRRRRKAK
jgi:hypothetical protein